MKTGIPIALALVLVAPTVSATRVSASADRWQAAASLAPADDNMTPYRTLAADTQKAFKAHDLTAARKKAKELETAWDKNEKALQKKSPDVWNQIDKAMDDFIKPLADKAADAAKVQTAYDAFIAKLQMAVKGA
jgi:hypothetical protein